MLASFSPLQHVLWENSSEAIRSAKLRLFQPAFLMDSSAEAPSHCVSLEILQKIMSAYCADALTSRKLNAMNINAFYESVLNTQAGGRKKKSGIYYTPPELAAFLTQVSLGEALSAIFREIETILERESSQASFSSINNLLKQAAAYRIVDPACGCGILLVEALKVLHRFYRQVWELCLNHPPVKDNLMDDPGLQCLCTGSARYIVAHQLAGVEIDPVALAMAEWALMSTVAELEGLTHGAANVTASLAPVSLQLFAGDALECDPQSNSQRVGGFPAFTTWEKTFGEETIHGGFDFILGNPPYLTEVRGNAELFRKLKTNSRVSKQYHAKMDLSDAFLWLGLELLKPGGQMAYVLPEYWLHRESAKTIRHALWHSGVLRLFIDSGGQVVFSEAPGHHSGGMVFLKHEDYRENPSLAPFRGERPEMGGTYSVNSATEIPPTLPSPSRGEGKYFQLDIFSLRGEVLDSPHPSPLPLRGRVGWGVKKEQYHQPCEIGIRQEGGYVKLPGFSCIVPASGRIAYGDVDHIRLLERLNQCPPLFSDSEIMQGLTIPKAKTEKSEQGVFVLTDEEVNALALSPLERACLQPYYETKGFQAFSGFSTPPQWLIYADAVFIRNINAYPRLKAHLDCYAGGNPSDHAPYGLHRPRHSVWFEAGEKILGIRQAQRPSFARIPQTAYVNEGFYIIRASGETLAGDILTGILNSDLAWFWLYHQKRKGDRLQVDKDVLKHFPAPCAIDFLKRQRQIDAIMQTFIANQTISAPLWKNWNELIFDGYDLSEPERDIIRCWTASRKKK